MKFREKTTKAGTLLLAGKNAENNEELVAQAGKNEIVLHTKKPGSPFVNIKGRPKLADVKEAALFCAAYSKDWKQNKSDVAVHKFLGRDIYKTKSMPVGTFAVKKAVEIIVKKKELEKYKK